MRQGRAVRRSADQPGSPARLPFVPMVPLVKFPAGTADTRVVRA